LNVTLSIIDIVICAHISESQIAIEILCETHQKRKALNIRQLILIIIDFLSKIFQ